MDLTWYDELEAGSPHRDRPHRFAPSPTGYMHVGNLRTALTLAHRPQGPAGSSSSAWKTPTRPGR